MTDELETWGGRGCLLMMVGTCVIMVWFLLEPNTGQDASERETSVTRSAKLVSTYEAAVRTNAEKIVRRSLTYPEDAVFAWAKPSINFNDQLQTWSVHGDVVAKIAPGEIVTLKYVCFLSQDAMGWKAHYIEIGTEVVLDEMEERANEVSRATVRTS